jgi:hypothetical protein
MAHWSIRRLLVWFLTVLVTAGLSLSVIQAAAMMPVSAPTAMASMDMNSASDHGCKLCNGKTDAGKAMTCSAVCAGPIGANQWATAIVLVSKPVILMALDNLPTGKPPAPDPYPPRPFDIV